MEIKCIYKNTEKFMKWAEIYISYMQLYRPEICFRPENVHK